jgi:hypothetical protein
MTWNSTLYNCKGKPEVVTKALSAASSGSSSKATTSLHFLIVIPSLPPSKTPYLIEKSILLQKDWSCNMLII